MRLLLVLLFCVLCSTSVAQSTTPGFVTYTQIYDEMNVSEVWTDGDYYVMLTATWCAPCQVMKQKMRDAGYFGRRIALIDIDVEPKLYRSIAGGRNGIPQLIRYRVSHVGGKVRFQETFLSSLSPQPSVEQFFRD